MTGKIYYSCRTFKNVISPAQAIFFVFSSATKTREKEEEKIQHIKMFTGKQISFFLDFFLSSFRSLNVFKFFKLLFSRILHSAFGVNSVQKSCLLGGGKNAVQHK
jgi:hypothetical protein